MVSTKSAVSATVLSIGGLRATRTGLRMGHGDRVRAKNRPGLRKWKESGAKNGNPGFKDKVAIVTGGSSGIGKETAKRLVAHGASVLIGGRDEAKLQSAAAEIGGTSGKVRVLAGDISSPATGAALVESAERHFGGLDKFDSGTRWPSFTTQGGGR